MVHEIKVQSWGDSEQDEGNITHFQEPDPEQREQLIKDEQDPALRGPAPERWVAPLDPLHCHPRTEI